MNVDAYTYTKFEEFEKIFFQKLNDISFDSLANHKKKLKKLIALSTLNTLKKADYSNEDEFNFLLKEYEAEKKYYGEELHNGLEQVLSSLNFYLDVLVRENKSNTVYLKAIKKLCLDALTLTKDLSDDLLYNELSKKGLLAAYRDLISLANLNNPLKIKLNTEKNFYESKLSITKKHQVFKSFKIVLKEILKKNNKEDVRVSLSFKYGTIIKQEICQETIKSSKFNYDEIDLKGYNNLEHRLSLLDSKLQQKNTKDLELIIKTPLNS